VKEKSKKQVQQKWHLNFSQVGHMRIITVKPLNWWLKIHQL